ncbi:MAG TPA: hypothetical protein VFF98_01265 [Novosphingobium sp.]|nr:hypothetical protein [Novosphingobium sp.]
MAGPVWCSAAFAAAILGGAVPFARAAPPPPAPAPHAYADIVDLADSARLVMQAEVRGQATVEPARAPGVKPGWARIYVEARPAVILRGDVPLAESVHYLADVPLDAKGKVPSLKKQQVLLFAHTLARGAEDLQLVAADAQWLADPALVDRVHKAIGDLFAPDAAPPVTAITQALYEPGTLAGEGETQLFLATAKGEPASISVLHQPDQPVHWSVSFSEVVNPDAPPPAHDTLAWYRLACFLPARLPDGINISATPDARLQAERDYRLVLAELGPCGRLRD